MLFTVESRWLKDRYYCFCSFDALPFLDFYFCLIWLREHQPLLLRVKNYSKRDLNLEFAKMYDDSSG